MLTVDEIKKIFGLIEDREVGELFSRSAAAVSKWRSGGVPAAIERCAYEIMVERGIISEPPAHYAPNESPERRLNVALRELVDLVSQQSLSQQYIILGRVLQLLEDDK